MMLSSISYQSSLSKRKDSLAEFVKATRDDLVGRNKNLKYSFRRDTYLNN